VKLHHKEALANPSTS